MALTSRSGSIDWCRSGFVCVINKCKEQIRWGRCVASGNGESVKYNPGGLVQVTGPWGWDAKALHNITSVYDEGLEFAYIWLAKWRCILLPQNFSGLLFWKYEQRRSSHMLYLTNLSHTKPLSEFWYQGNKYFRIGLPMGGQSEVLRPITTQVAQISCMF